MIERGLNILKTNIKKILVIAIAIFTIVLAINTDNLGLINYPQYQNFNYPIKEPLNIELKSKSENNTLLNASYICYYEISIYKFEPYNITFNYTDANTNETLLGADANYTWYKKNDISLYGNGALFDLSNGLYTLDFNTSSRDIGEYIINIYIKKENYTKPTMVLFLTIQKRPTNFLILTGTTLKFERGLPYIFLFNLKDYLNQTALDGFTIRWTMGFISGNLISLADGYYILPFPTSTLALGSNLIILDTSANVDYQIPSTTISVEITWEKIIGVDLPIFYAIIIILTIVIGGILSYRVIKRIRIPSIIKKINKSIENIKNHESPILIYSIKSRDTIYKEFFDKDEHKFGKNYEIKQKEANI